MTDLLPPNATEASRIRYELARELAERCPPELGREIAVTGSVARGLADNDSDIELNFWVETLPSPEKRAEWLRSIGATGVVLDPEPERDGSIWAMGRYRGVWLEPGWQTIETLETILDGILTGQVIDHPRLILAEIVAHAVAVRTGGLLARWQERLAHYPDIVQERLIAAAARRWTPAPFRWALVRRGERLALAERLVWDVHNILRILFALNRQWEPDWKWARQMSKQLAIKPERLAERIDEIFSTPDAERSVEACHRLVLDTLALVPPPHDVSATVAAVQESLRARAP